MSFHENGFAVVEDVISPSECDALVSRIGSNGSRSVGSRCLLELGWCQRIAETLCTQMATKLGGVQDAVPVQCTYFQKTVDKNWLVPWHQDRSIPVDAEVQSNELTGWSRKEGVIFVHAPEEVICEMFAVRLHLDDSTLSNGPLRVIPGSHRNGTLTPEQIEEIRKNTKETPCVVRKGGVVAMRPLLLHASSKSTTTDPRRVLHFLFGPEQLPHGLRWRRLVE